MELLIIEKMIRKTETEMGFFIKNKIISSLYEKFLKWVILILFGVSTCTFFQILTPDMLKFRKFK